MIAITFALEFESAVFAAKHGRQLRVGTWILGAMGAGTAAALEKKLSAAAPGLVVAAGFAGGLQPGYCVGDLVLAENYTDSTVAEVLRLGPDWKRGRLVTVPAIVETAEEKGQLGAETGCDIADMETAHLADVCRRHSIPMLAVRCVSDAVDDDMPVPAEVLLNPKTCRPDPLGLFKHLVANPSCVAGFNGLLKNAKMAQDHLATGLIEILPQLLHLTRRGG